MNETLHGNLYIRFKESIQLYWQGARQWSELHPQAVHGQARFDHNVWLSHERYGPVPIAFARLKGSRETGFIVSDQPTSAQTFEQYGLRFDIEENFLVDKSPGFRLQVSQIRDAKALTRLCLVVAGATLFLISQGMKVVNKGRRRWIDLHWFRGLSYLKIG